MYLGKAFSSIRYELPGHAACAQPHTFCCIIMQTQGERFENIIGDVGAHFWYLFGIGSKSFTACSFQDATQHFGMRIKIGRVNTAVQTVEKCFI